MDTNNTLVAAWYDSDIPSDRLRSVQLWRLPSGTTLVLTAERTGPWDMWSPPHLHAAGWTREQTAAYADSLGLDPYIVRKPSGRAA